MYRITGCGDVTSRDHENHRIPRETARSPVNRGMLATFDPLKPPGRVFVIKTSPAEGLETAMPVPDTKIDDLTES